jgi:hypothetical protein
MDIRLRERPRTRTTGVRPRGDQVFACGGVMEKPASSSKTSQAPRAAAATFDASGVCFPGLLNCGSSLIRGQRCRAKARRRRPDADALAPPCLRQRGRTSSPARAHKGAKRTRPGVGTVGSTALPTLPDSGPASSKTRGPLGHIAGRGETCPSSWQAYGPLIMLDPKPGRTPAKPPPPTSRASAASHVSNGLSEVATMVWA